MKSGIPTPYDLAAERALIGAALIDESVPDRIPLTREHFGGGEHRRIWHAILELRAQAKPLDVLLVAERAEVSPAVLSECAVATPTSANAEHYAEILREHAMTRAVLHAAAELTDLYRLGKAAGSELLGRALEQFTAIDVDRPSGALTIGQVLRERLAELDAIARARASGESTLTGVTTGLDRLDTLLGGLQRGIVTILAGRPAMGKSAAALGIADAATAAGHGVHVFSLEDARSAYADRALARTARVPTDRIRTCTLARGDMPRITASAATLCKRERWLYEDASALTADELVLAVRRERVSNRTELVIVDYLQLLSRPRRYESVHDAIAQNLDVLARAAKHDDMAYLVLSQLSRQVERRDDKRPTLADLRDSGSLEERAKCVLAMYRGAYYGPPKAGVDYDDSDPDDGRPSDVEWERRVDILVLKNSHGRTGFVRCRWDGPCTRVS